MAEILLDTVTEIATETATEIDVKQKVASVLPTVVTDYLDLLLRGSTEFLERHWSRFDCLRFEAGEHELLIPLDRISRIEPSAALNKEPSAALNRQPSAALNRQPSAAFSKEPSASLNKKPSAKQLKVISIPGCDGEEKLVLSLHHSNECILIRAVLDIVEVKHEEVLWRDINQKTPWFVGTHKTYLCRLFEPKFILS